MAKASKVFHLQPANLRGLIDRLGQEESACVPEDASLEEAVDRCHDLVLADDYVRLVGAEPRKVGVVTRIWAAR
jgi:hypothetical protein